jgi:hypothetical protein
VPDVPWSQFKMTWIKLDHTTQDKPEVFLMADRLGIDPDAVLGKLVRVWVWADQQTTDGNAPSVTSSLLDRITGVSGFAAALQQVGWLTNSDDGLIFPNFTRHNGQTSKARALTAQRVAKSRSGNGAKCNGRSVTEALPEKRREEKIEDTKVSSPPSPQAAAGSGERFACVGGEWELPAAKLEAYREAFPGVDLVAEFRKVRIWLDDHPPKRPRAGRGAQQFLSRWLGKAHEAARRTASTGDAGPKTKFIGPPSPEVKARLDAAFARNGVPQK